MRRVPGWAWRVTLVVLSAVHEECIWDKKTDSLEGFVKIMHKNIILNVS